MRFHFISAVRDAARWHIDGRHAAARVSWFVAWTLATRWRYPTTAEYKERITKILK